MSVVPVIQCPECQCEQGRHLEHCSRAKPGDFIFHEFIPTTRRIPIKRDADGIYRCTCNCGERSCPLGRMGMQLRCTRSELETAGVETVDVTEEPIPIEKPHRQQPKTLEKEQHAGKHYKAMPIQPAEYNQLNKDFFGWCEGEAIKLISRHRAKNGSTDLKKAIHYIKMVLELDYNETYDPEGE